MCHFFHNELSFDPLPSKWPSVGETTVTVCPHYEDKRPFLCVAVSDERSMEEIVSGEENDSLCRSVIE
ncbi:hypothetical protein F2P81_023859 [Scophthalmus maximus]|uniref:Uncharacterized protein n=1 Tax=Scophthalmus maximus TaxID=52904 RepID=A0A6A4RSG6_SCOMX|nr:hypothetical protein F2P81_023859 [Scophthalmus maximus]